MNGKKEIKERKLILVGVAGPMCACDACEGGCNGVVCLQRVAWWWDRGGAGCSGDGRLCQGGGDVVGVAAATRLGTMGSVSYVGDRAMWWQIRLCATSDVVVSERG